MEIKKTETGLYTTITKESKVIERVNVFNTEREAIDSLGYLNRLKYKFNIE